MTELPGLLRNPRERFEPRLGSIGLPNDGIELRLVAVEADAVSRAPPP